MCRGTPGSDIGLGPLAGVYDAVGRWLVEHPAPQWLVNSRVKTRLTEMLAAGALLYHTHSLTIRVRCLRVRTGTLRVCTRELLKRVYRYTTSVCV